MKIIFGLGNPGFWYRNTRHNIGFRVCRQYAKIQGWKFRKQGFQCRYLIERQGEDEVVLSLPQTYMNRSGEAVKAMLNVFPVDAGDMLVVVDDFQLPLGCLRFRSKGSSGGHKGLESICHKIGENFCRLRLGIGPKPQNRDITKFVLSRWRRNEKKAIRLIIKNAAAALETFMNHGIERAMSKHNSVPLLQI